MSELTSAIWELEKRVNELEEENELLREIIEKSGVDADEILDEWR